MPLVYMMAGVSLVLPVLILVMTTMMGGETDLPTGAEAVETFTNVRQSIGTAGGESATGLAGMCNVNMIYFLIAVFVCIFVADDYRSGYVKNLFAVRAGRTDYCVSKTVVGFVGGTIFFLLYLIGTLIGGEIAGLSFSSGSAGAGGIVFCMLAKIFLGDVFTSIALLAGVAAKQKLWLSVLLSLAVGMLLYMMIPAITPLDSTFFNVVLFLAGGVLFAAGLGAVSRTVLRKTDVLS